MSTAEHDLPMDSLPRLVVSYVGQSVFYGILVGLFLAAMGWPILGSFHENDPVAFTYAFIALTALAIQYSQAHIFGDLSESESSDELSTLILDSIAAFLMVNLLLFAASVMGVIAAASLGGFPGMAVAFFWPYWEFRSAENEPYAIPLSTLGSIVFVLQLIDSVTSAAGQLAEFITAYDFRLDYRIAKAIIGPRSRR